MTVFVPSQTTNKLQTDIADARVSGQASLQVNAPLTEKTRGRGWVVLVVKTKMAEISLVSK